MCVVASRHLVGTKARRYYLVDPHVRPLRKISHDTRGECVQDLTIVWWVVEGARKILHCAMGYIRGGEVGWMGSISINSAPSLLLQVYYYTSKLDFNTYKPTQQPHNHHQNEQLRLPPTHSLPLFRLNSIFFDPHNTLLAVSPPIPRVSARRA